MISFLRRVDSWIASVEAWMLTGLILGMAGVAVLQVFLRNFVPGHALSWADVAVRHGVFWVGFIGASLAASHGKHLAIDVMSHVLPPVAKTEIAKLTDFFACLVAATFAWQAWRFLGMEGDYTYVILPLGFGMVSLRFLLRIFAGEEGK